MDFYGRVKILVKKNRYPSLQEFIISQGLNHDSYYSQKRAGNLPRADEAVKIAMALGTSVEYLVAGNNSKSLTENSVADEILEELQGILKKYRKANIKKLSK